MSRLPRSRTTRIPLPQERATFLRRVGIMIHTTTTHATTATTLRRQVPLYSINMILPRRTQSTPLSTGSCWHPPQPPYHHHHPPHQQQQQQYVSFSSSSSSSSLPLWNDSFHSRRRHHHHLRKNIHNTIRHHRYQSTMTTGTTTSTTTSGTSSPTHVTTATTDHHQHRSSALPLLDAIPNDLSAVVQQILQYLEIHHEDTHIRARYDQNYQHAQRYVSNEHVYPRLAVSTTTTTPAAIATPTTTPTMEVTNNGHGNHHHPDLEHHHVNGSSSNSSSNDINGLDGIRTTAIQGPVLNGVNGHLHDDDPHHHRLNGATTMTTMHHGSGHDMNGYNDSSNNNNSMPSSSSPTIMSLEDAISDLASTPTEPTMTTSNRFSAYHPQHRVTNTSTSPFTTTADAATSPLNTTARTRGGAVHVAKPTDEIAIFHALKNDYVPGGHVERTVTLPTKTEATPFQNRSMETLLAVTSNQDFDEMEEPGTVSFINGSTNSDDNDDSNHHHHHHHSLVEQKIYSAILSNDFMTNRSDQSNDSTTTNSNQTHVATLIKNPDGLTFDEDIHPQVPPSSRNPMTKEPHITNHPPPLQQQQQPQHCDPSELHFFNLNNNINDNTYDVSLQSWFKSIFLENDRDTDNTFATDISTLNGSDENSETIPDTEHNNEGQPAVSGSSNSEDALEGPLENDDESALAAEARQKSLTEALVLLRTLTEDQWVCFDLGTSQENTVVDNEPSNEARIVDMIAEILSNDGLISRNPLSSTDFNYSLARMAIATDVAADEILALLMQTHRLMSELARAGYRESEPNSTTHEILLLVLVRRLSAYHNAIDLLVSISKDPSFQWTPKVLQAASELCERKDLLRMSRSLTNIIQTFDTSMLKIPKRVFISLINVCKDNDARSDAIDLLKISMKQSAGRSDQLLDEIFVHAIKWPYKNRIAGFIDNSSMLADIVSLLENETLYVAGFPVWKQLIYTSSYGATKAPSRYDFIVKAFRYCSVADPTYFPDQQLLRQGLEACEVVADSDLVWDLLRRAIVNYAPSQLLLSTSALHQRPHVPFRNFAAGMNICLKDKNMDACEKILQVSKQIDMTPINRRSLYVLMLKGYASVGDTENVLDVIEAMNDELLNPCEECYGALFYAFAMSNQIDQARLLLTEMESGTSPIRPGPTCYDGFILACARARAWEDILTAYDTMQSSKIPLSAASSHGILLAAAKMGPRQKVLPYVNSFVTSHAQLHGDGAMLALRILLNGIVIGGNTNTHDELTLDEIRERLRMFGQSQPSLQGPCLNLIRSLRMAEFEEARMMHRAAHERNDTIGRNRNRTETVPMTEILDRRHDAWRTMLTDLISLVNAIEVETSSSSSSSSHHESNRVEHV